jgi:hypothetical protein
LKKLAEFGDDPDLVTEYENPKVTVLGDSSAIFSAILWMEFPMPGTPGPGGKMRETEEWAFLITDVWTNNAGTWQIVRRHASIRYTRHPGEKKKPREHA